MSDRFTSLCIGGKLVFQYTRKRPSPRICGATGVKLHGVSVVISYPLDARSCKQHRCTSILILRTLICVYGRKPALTSACIRFSQQASKVIIGKLLLFYASSHVSL